MSNKVTVRYLNNLANASIQRVDSYEDLAHAIRRVSDKPWWLRKRLTISRTKIQYSLPVERAESGS